MQGDDFQDKPDIKSEYIKMTLVCWILVDKYGLAIYNENRVKKRLSTYLDCGGLASVIFPTMKSQGAAKNEANNAAQSTPVEKTVEKAIAEVKETYDFSNVEVEPLFKDMVDFETFSKSDFRAVKVKECEAVPKSKKLLKFVLNDGSGEDRVILSGIHDYYEPEELVGKTLLAITNLPPRKMMGIDSCGMIISATHIVEGREGLNVLILDDKIPAGAKLY